MTLNEKFSQNLKSHRADRRLSQTALALRAGVCVSYVSMLERGQRSPPLETVEAFAKALRVSPVALLS